MPYRYLFKMSTGQYCLGVFDNGWQGTLLGGIITRNVLVQVSLLTFFAVATYSFQPAGANQRKRFELVLSWTQLGLRAVLVRHF